jgi:hypothetical protein
MDSFDDLLRDDGKETEDLLWSILKEEIMRSLKKKMSSHEVESRDQSNNFLCLGIFMKGKNFQLKKSLIIPFQILTGVMEVETSETYLSNSIINKD